jgi:UDPglucose 6-dehydrogenase
MHVSIIGAGYVGLVTGAGLARLGHAVSLVEINPARLGPLLGGRVPFHEPGLQELLSEGLSSGSLRATGNVGESLSAGGLVMVCVGTPLRDDGDADLSQVMAACRDIASHAPHLPVVVRSTLPLGSTSHLAEWLGRSDLGGVLTNPEFLRQGSAVADFLKPTRIVVGCEDGEDNAAVAQVRSLYAHLDAPFLVTDFASAEMIKNAANAFLATKLSFINEVADLCEAYGASVDDVVTGIGLDPRIGASYLRPGIGFGGSCLPKELANMVRLGQAHELKMPLMTGAAITNEERPARVADRLQRMLGSLTGSRVALLGLTFKPHTDDTRYSPAIALSEELLRRGAMVVAHDPVLRLDADSVPAAVERAADVVGAVTGADLVVLATEWPDYLDLDWAALAGLARRTLLYDGRGVLDRDAAERAGWTVARVGVGEGTRAVELGARNVADGP